MASMFAVSLVANSAVRVDGLHTMHLTNPVGIDASPVFSWMIDSDKRGVVQESYNIVVATDPSLSQIVWESGTVTSSEAANVKAEGFTPAPSTRYYWGVTVTDNYGEKATSTIPAYFETGLMESGWSGAQWINSLGQTKGGDDTGSSFDPSTVKNYTVEADFEIERVAAGIIWGATDHNNYYMWQFNIERNPTKFRPHRWAGGGAACLAEIDVPLEKNKPYHMKVEVSDNGTVAKTYLDDVLIDTREGNFPYGDMGVRSAMAENYARYSETAYYDDFKVSAGSKVLFEDHFDTADNFDNGKVVGNQLRVEGVCYAWQKNFVPDETVKDYTFEGKFNIDQVAAGLCFAGIDGSHYYMWQFNIEKSQPMFRPHRWNGGAACLAEIPLNDKIKIEQGREYVFRIEVTDGGTKAKTYINNVLIDEREGEFAYGRIGIRADRGEVNTRTYERSFYDNFKTTDETGKTLYSENFDNPGAISLTAGDAIDGRLRVGAYGDVYSWTIDNSKLDPNLHYTIDADMTLVKDNAEIIFSHTGANNFFMWAINTKDHTNPCVRRHVYAGSGTPTWSDTEIYTVSTAALLGAEHHLKIEVQGRQVTTSIDGVIVDVYTDTSGTLTFGNLGFRSNVSGSEDERAYWDNIKVTVYNADGTETVTLDENFEGESNQFEDGEVINVEGNNKLYMYSKNGQTKIFENKTNGAPIFRKEFAVDGEVATAKLYTTALGNYNVFINGERVGHVQPDGETVYDELMPGWTEYRKKVFYMTHDVTSLVKEGANAIGVQLSSGWWGGDIAHGVYGSPNLAFMGKLVITLKNGETLTIVSDDSWAFSTESPVKRGDIYHGETYDARDADGWASAGYNAAGWSHAGIDSQFKGVISAYEGPAVRIRKHLERKPQTITVYEGVKSTGTTHGEINVVSTSGNRSFKLKKGQTAVFDMGQNFVGWPHFSVKGPRGTVLKMRFAEMLNDKGDASRGDDGPGGSLYTINLRNAKCLLKYTLSGAEAGEEYHPSTTFYGFRYCEITASDDITVNSLVGQVVGSEIEEGSNIEVNHDAVNQLYSNVLWGQRSNFLSVPTDCPQRDERLGWTADTQVFSLAASYNSDVLAFYHKWMGDMRDSQREDGAYPDVAPYCWVGFGQAAWGDAGIILPWNVYTMYGDKSIIEENFESMEHYMSFIANQAGGGYKYNGSGADSYGDWVAFEYTDRRYVSVAYYGYMAYIMSEMAKAIGEDAKAAGYAQLFDNIRKEFAQRYVKDGKLIFDTQCAQLLALNFNLLPDETAVENSKTTLRRKIESNGNKLSTGFLGTSMINQTLSRYGMDDLAYTLLLQRECPSWLYSVDQGATTIWERWDSYTREKGFHSDITMNSFNHYAYGAVAEWMYRYMGGIAPDAEKPGFRHINLSPVVDNRTNLNNQQRITDVKATFASPYGDVKSNWVRRDDGSVVYHVTIPANTTATVTYPLAAGQTAVYEGEVPAEEAEGVSLVAKNDKQAVYNLGSGSYVFAPDVKTGVENIESKKAELLVTPNPARDHVEIISTSAVESVEIYSMSGASSGKQAVTDNKVDVSGLSAGVYVIRVKTADGAEATSKLVKL